MAKQIYVDENGNPIEVSGTINNASMLPISGNDPTDTKSYIDTGLSGVSVTFSPSSGVTLGNNSIFALGVLVSITADLRADANANTWTNLGTVNKKPSSNLCVPCINENTGAYLGMVQVQSSGTIRIYPISNVTVYDIIGFSITYAS